jgi:hypothetical protein
MKPAKKFPRALRRRRSTRISKSKFAIGMGQMRAELEMPIPPANPSAVQIGQNCLPQGDRD